MTLFRHIIALVALLVADTVSASSVLQQQSTLYPYKSTIELQDDFLGGLTTSGAIGNLGWIFSNGTVSIQLSEANRLGIVRRDTSAVSGTTAALLLYNSSTAVDMSLPLSTVFVVRLNTNDANTTVRVGLRDNSSGLLPTAGIYFEKLDADTNWFCVARQASVETRVDTGVSISTSFITMEISKNSSGSSYKLNGSTVCSSPISTNNPTAFNNAAINITNSAAASKTIDVDYFQIHISGIVR